MKHAFLFALAFSPVPALADPPREPEPVAYAFEDDLVHGDLTNPRGEVLVVRKGAGRPSLIEVRQSFVRELAKSIEDL